MHVCFTAVASSKAWLDMAYFTKLCKYHPVSRAGFIMARRTAKGQALVF